MFDLNLLFKMAFKLCPQYGVEVGKICQTYGVKSRTVMSYGPVFSKICTLPLAHNSFIHEYKLHLGSVFRFYWMLMTGYKYIF